MEAIKGIAAAFLLVFVAWLVQGAVPDSQLGLYWVLVLVVAFAVGVGAFLSRK